MDQRLYWSRRQRLSDRPEFDPDRQTAAIWSAIVSWLSIRTPGFLTAVENYSIVPFRNVNICGRVLFSWCRVPSQMICVLSSLSFMRLLAIQSRTRLGSRRCVQFLPCSRLLLHWYIHTHTHTQNQNGNQSGKGSGLRQPFWSSSAFMDWLRHICLS